MARSVANITVDILRDRDWISLTAGAQRLYALVILTQPKLSLCGYLDTISPGRWSTLAADTDPTDLQAALDELEQREYVVIDHVTEELIVRTFVKNDLDASRLSANVCKGFWASWKSITSPELRQAVVDNCPEEHWAKLAKVAPHDALQIRRSSPLEREAASPSEWGSDDPSEREQHDPSASPVTCHLSPVTSHQQPRATPIGTPTDQPDEPAAAAAEDHPDAVIDQALALLVERTIARKPAHSNPTAYRRSLEAGKRTDHYDIAHDWLQRDPELTPGDLADILEPPAYGPLPTTGYRPPTPPQQRPHCTRCHGTSWVNAPDTDGVIRCPDCTDTDLDVIRAAISQSADSDDDPGGTP